MRYFSMFSGIGGFELGIQQAFDSSKDRPATPQLVRHTQRPRDNDLPRQHNVQTPQVCVDYSEIDKYAIKVYERNFSGHRNYGDATNINPTDLPDFDLLVGGFPCQAFSIAGKRAGFNDTRGTLFFDIARILADKRPRHLVLENVKGLLSHEGGQTIQTILKVLADLGYRVEYQVLNSKDFGVPQNRERVYIIGHLRDECGGQVLPITGANRQAIEVIGYLNSETWQKRNESTRRVYSVDGIAPTIPTAQGGGVMAKIVAQRGRYNVDGKTEQQFEPRTDNLTNTLTAVQKDNLVNEPPRIRRLTPKECERLQGFPDQWTKYGEDEHGMRVDISDSQRYKMCGNAVTTNVVEAVMTALQDCLRHN